MLKKLLLSFLAALIVLFSFAPYFVAKAAPTPAPSAPTEGTWYNQSFNQWYNKVYDENVSPGNEIFGERYTAAQVQWVIYGLFAFILNASLGNSSDSQAAVACFITNSGNFETCKDALDKIFGSVKGAQSSILPQQKDDKSLLQLVFADRSLSGITYVKEKLHKFSLVPEVQAQAPGFGFGALKPVQDMWRGARDISFGLFVIAAIILAFMIMFRVKISPQVVISVQSAIPKLIVALILVTFSYAIAGFLIDLMYIVYGLFSIAGSAFVPFFNIKASTLFQFLTTGRIGKGSIAIDLGIFGLLVLYLMFLALAFVVVLFFTLGVLQSAMLGALTAAFATVAGGLFPIIGVILLIIAIIIILWMGIRIIWTLLKAFVNVLLLTIFAPLQIAAGTFVPSLNFGVWLRNYTSNLAVFVTASILIFFSYVFLLLGIKAGFEGIFSGVGGGISGFIEFIFRLLLGSNVSSAVREFGVPSSPWPPLLGAAGPIGGGAQNITGLLFLAVSFVSFTLIPKAADLVQSFIQGKPFAYGAAIGETLGPLKLAGLFGAGAAAQYLERTGGPATPGGPPVSSARITTAQVIRRVTGVK